ncbi:MAG: hypothetical protein CMF71_06290 [Magnetovibrio sp.]|nr:hypothetical protein [Magnetovibrio sp.]MBH89814.1 hypothetical protein [Magnetovibrio sp.]|tara:strand:- start:330 stop:620 length:291 start_codon:yes stop_codon:yes gene_type:complete
MNKESKKATESHWLVHPKTIKNLWKGGLLLLVILIFADFLITPHPYFIIDSTFGFYAWYGFFSCALMVIVAKVLGLLVKRSDTYYSDKDESGDKHV